MENSEQQKLIDQGYAEGKKSFEFLWNQIRDNFKWEAVYMAMKATDWHWHFGGERYGIPRIDTLQRKAYDMLKEIYDEGKGSVSTGGFIAGWDGPELYLVFNITEWQTGE